MKKDVLKIALVVLLCCGGLAQAVPITIQITGEVTTFSDYTGLLNTIHVGSSFSGTYTYDSSVADSGGGHYYQNTPYGVNLTLGGFEFQTNSSQALNRFEIWLVNDGIGNGIKDFYLVRSYKNTSLPNGVAVSLIRWDLNDSTHTALSSTALPTTTPSLAAWNYNYVEIYGGNSQNGFYLGGTVTRATPEPLTSILMATGMFLFRRRR
jgi:hypothetical protein